MQKLIKIILPLLFTFTIAVAQKKEARNWLSNSLTQANKDAQLFDGIDNWRKTNKLAFLKALQQLPDSIKQKLITKADAALKYNWPSLPATLYLDYKDTGTRTNYENLNGERRKKLFNLIVGELLQNNGKYLPQIVNGLWLVMEESTWVAPAHIVLQKEGVGLPGAYTEYVDLHASRTAANIAIIYHLLGEKLDGFSKVINPRIKKELNQRIFTPYLKHDFYWMGFKDNSVNNWNTFNNANCLEAALLTLQPGDTLNRLTDKIAKSVDFFINQYPADGGCDEGPSYWDMAGGKLAYLLQNFQSVSKGRINLTNYPLIHAIGTYTYKMQISGTRMVNFADALANYKQNPANVFAFGQLFNDQELNSYAAFLFKANDQQIPADDLMDFTSTVACYASLIKYQPKSPYLRSVVLPNLQVWTARENGGTDKGLFVAAKGGNNAESHNHNDIGNFIIYNNGNPVLIDVGVGTYTSKTFSAKRYEIWNVQSQWHNTPIVNGFGQKDGKNYKALDFLHQVNGDKESLRMDLAKAYPKEAMVDRWKRTITLDRPNHSVLIDDDFKLLENLAPQELVFICANQPAVKNNKIDLGGGLMMLFDQKIFEAKVEEQELEDMRFQNNWGKTIYRIKLIARKNELQGSYQIKIQSKK